ncbi:MAG TPA: hypothetical protein VK427_13835, partial [Kofleriaceae bacterium]|nr:hypothetical protein [Kofleriaceae bacterium]
DISCHCALGSMAQVLHACGVDIASELPWVKPWFLRYQMADGGLSCDETAYRVVDQCPSSMVGTIAPFEAMLVLASTPEEHQFVERAATFLVQRGLVRGSDTTHNAEERDAAPAWMQHCFPRLYFYDVLRGLDALVRWAAGSLDRRIPALVLEPVIRHLVAAYPDGVVRVERRAFRGIGSIAQSPHGTGWIRQPVAATFPLLELASMPGTPSLAGTRSWNETRQRLRDLAARGQLA